MSETSGNFSKLKDKIQSADVIKINGHLVQRHIVSDEFVNIRFAWSDHDEGVRYSIWLDENDINEGEFHDGGAVFIGQDNEDDRVIIEFFTLTPLVDK